MNFKFRHYFLFLLAILGLASCEVELDISSVIQRKRLVVNAVLNDKDKVQIWVSESTSLKDSVKPGALNNAVVEIIDPAGNKSTCAFNSSTNYYESNIDLISGNKYSISVKASGYPDASASLFIPAISGLKPSSWQDSTSLDSFGFPLGTLTVAIDDNGAELNYYRVTIFYYDDLLAEWFALVPNTKDADINSQAITTEDGGIIFSDNSFSGKSKSIGFITPFGFAFQTPKFLVVAENLSEDYYRYFQSLDNYRRGGGIFSEPSAIYTNITNGLGIAAGSSIRRDTIQ